MNIFWTLKADALDIRLYLEIVLCDFVKVIVATLRTR